MVAPCFYCGQGVHEDVMRLNLSPTEARAFHLLLTRNDVVYHSEITSCITSGHVFIHRLRQAIMDAQLPYVINNVRGEGYVLKRIK